MFYMRLVASFGLIFMGGRTYQLNRYGQIPQPEGLAQFLLEVSFFVPFEAEMLIKVLKFKDFL